MSPEFGQIATIVPAIDEPHVMALCEKVVLGKRPERVKCEPDPLAQLNECFATVANRIARLGGSRAIGWAIWEFPGAYIEAELHSVWRSPSGDLLDVSRRAKYFEGILFLSDPARVDDGRIIDNVRMPLTSDNDVKRHLFLCSQQYQILNRGDRALQREVSLGRRELKDLQGIQKELSRLSN